MVTVARRNYISLDLMAPSIRPRSHTSSSKESVRELDAFVPRSIYSALHKTIQAFDGWKASTQRLLGREPEEKTSLQQMEEAVCGGCPTLSYRNRLIGFGACLAMGFLLTFGSLFRLGLDTAKDIRQAVILQDIPALCCTV